MAGTSLNQNLNQTQTLAPQMRQSLEVLQANALELQQLLRQFIETNPVIEHDLSSVSLDELGTEGKVITSECTSIYITRKATDFLRITS